jgi:alkylhydroperoxidase/carboxymuconolactone decarboxylase family protein YurZ
MKDDTLPSVVDAFAREHPAIWEAYNQVGDAVGRAGPLDAKTQRLVKLAIAVGAGLQGAVHSHARRGLKSGCTPDELAHVAFLGITTVGWPSAFAAYCWIQDTVKSARAKSASKGRKR